MNRTYTRHGYSKIRDAEKCLAYYNYRWNLGLTPKRVSEAPLFGTVFHAARQAWYENNKDADAGVQAVKEIMIEYIGDDSFSVPDFSMYVLDAFYQYTERYKNDVLERTAFEVPFETEIGGFPFTGRLDGVVIVDGLVWVEEVKTTGITIPRFLQMMTMDGKTTGYIWAARKITGKLIQGAYLDVVYKKPKKSGFDFARDVTPRTDFMLNEWEKSTIHKLQRIEEHQKSGFWPHSWDSCSNMFGQCPYHDLCKYGERPELLATFNVDKEGGEEGGVGD